ncbi:hypothetical protein OG612_46005 (plasmid) [Streptomyces sp. NBC_01527]|uniref:hypothetical protein n=1 Tax=Streptomyces sp. NBC_01527 TaxID=2903894 RepID=UPI002F90E132
MAPASAVLAEEVEEELLIPVKLDEDDMKVLGGLMPPNCAGCGGTTCVSCNTIPHPH